LQPDEYVFLSHGGTLWSWPGQNPIRWRDPSGRFAGSAAWWGAKVLAGANPVAAVVGAGASGFLFGAAIAPYTSEALADWLNNNKAGVEADLARAQKENLEAIAK
jgi:hypothetical protein